MPPIYAIIILGLSFFVPLASLNPFISPEGRQMFFDLWLNKGIPLNLGLCIGLFIGSDMEAKYTQRLRVETQEAIRAGLRKIQNNS
jgi:hypothetical protein